MVAYYPVFLDLKGRRCVVIGAGEVAERKGRQLMSCGGEVTFISPEVTEGVRALRAEGRAAWEERPYRAGDLEGTFLAIAATDDAQVNQQVTREAEERKVLLNVVDVPELCQFIAPAVVERGPVTVAISTSGTSTALARKLRESLERWPALAWADAADVLVQVRQELKARRRRASPEAWQRAMDDTLLALVQAGRHREAVERLLASLTEPANVASR